MFLALGIYSCHINGSNELLRLLPAQWEKFRPSIRLNNEIISINLELSLDNVDTELTDGWSVCDIDGNQQFVYTRRRKTIFALRCISFTEVTVHVQKALDSYVRVGILYGLMLSLHQRCVGLHGVTLLCGDEIIILSAPSGTGKSTLASLLETYCEAVVINGDFALLTPTESGVVFEPTPFCGTSGRCLNHRVRINRVVFLEQSLTNNWRELTGREAMLLFSTNAFIPTWDSRMQQVVQDNILKSVSMLKANVFSFAPTKEAAEMFFNHLNRHE